MKNKRKTENIFAERTQNNLKFMSKFAYKNMTTFKQISVLCPPAWRDQAISARVFSMWPQGGESMWVCFFVFLFCLHVLVKWKNKIKKKKKTQNKLTRTSPPPPVKSTASGRIEEKRGSGGGDGYDNDAKTTEKGLLMYVYIVDWWSLLLSDRAAEKSDDIIVTHSVYRWIKSNQKKTRTHRQQGP